MISTKILEEVYNNEYSRYINKPDATHDSAKVMGLLAVYDYGYEKGADAGIRIMTGEKKQNDY